MNMSIPLVINLAGAPGAGKSTLAARIFSELKMKNINAELITEFAKDKTWEQNYAALKCQEYVFGKQSFRLKRCKDQVDVIVTDSPLFLGIMYNQNPALDYHFEQTVINVFNSYNNITYFVKRVKPYNPAGRNQTEAESDALVDATLALMNRFNIPYTVVTGDDVGFEQIMSDVLAYISNKIFVKATDVIDSFEGEYEFLSNFYTSPFIFKDPLFGNNKMEYKTNEHFFQAMKTLNPEERFAIWSAETPGKAKRLGRACTLREDWEAIKEDVMADGLYMKFSDYNLKQKLLNTGNALLIESNTWHDNYWGNCSCDKCKNIQGKNNLGLALMKLREEFNYEN